MKALDRIAKKISDAEGHLTKIEDSIDDKKHRTAQHETIKDTKSILKHARKVDKDEDKIEEFKSEGPKDSTENHYVYEEEETVINNHTRLKSLKIGHCASGGGFFSMHHKERHDKGAGRTDFSGRRLSS